AKMEIGIVRMAERPQTARPGKLEHVAKCRDFRRCHPAGHRVAVQPADHRVLGQTEATADLSGGQALLEQLSEALDPLLGPGDFHCSPRILWITDPPPQNKYHPCDPEATGIN